MKGWIVLRGHFVNLTNAVHIMPLQSWRKDTFNGPCCPAIEFNFVGGSKFVLTYSEDPTYDENRTRWAADVQLLNEATGTDLKTT